MLAWIKQTPTFLWVFSFLASCLFPAIPENYHELTSFETDQSGQISKVTYCDKQTASYEYDLSGRLIKLKHPDGEIKYSYDENKRLQKIQYSQGHFETFAYDDVGIRVSKTTPKEIIFYEYDEESRCVKSGDSIYTYDLEGRLIAKSSPTHEACYTYDGQNQLTSYTDESNQVTFEYDLHGNRLSKTVNGTCITYPSEQVLPKTNNRRWKGEKYDWWDKTTHYVYEDSQYYLYDNIGGGLSIIVDATGQILNKCALPDAKFDKESGLLYFKKRYYDPEIDSFISIEPCFINVNPTPIEIERPLEIEETLTEIGEIEQPLELEETLPEIEEIPQEIIPLPSPMPEPIVNNQDEEEEFDINDRCRRNF